MQVFWFAVIIDRLPDEFVDGIVLSEGFEEGAEPDLDQLQFVILARADADSEDEAMRLTNAAVSDYGPCHTAKLADRRENLTRAERRVADKLTPNEVSLKPAFVGVKRNDAAARQVAVSVLTLAVHKKWWEFWR